MDNRLGNILRKWILLMIKYCNYKCNFESDDTAELEKQYHKLQQKLYPIGIKRLISMLRSAQRIMVRTILDHTTQPNLVQNPSSHQKPMPSPLSMMIKPPTKAATKQSQLNAHPRITISSLWLQVKVALVNPQQR